MDMIKKRRYVTEAEVRFYAIQMAGAIKYMHAKGIIHRDLKMGNVFLDKDMNVKIGDFGLAALLMSGKDMLSCRRTTLCGTPNYIAPEILEKGKKGHDHTVDIWALGIIMYVPLISSSRFLLIDLALQCLLESHLSNRQRKTRSIVRQESWNMTGQNSAHQTITSDKRRKISLQRSSRRRRIDPTRTQLYSTHSSPVDGFLNRMKCLQGFSMKPQALTIFSQSDSVVGEAMLTPGT